MEGTLACLKGDVCALCTLQEGGEGYEQAVALQVCCTALEGCVPHIDLWPTPYAEQPVCVCCLTLPTHSFAQLFMLSAAAEMFQGCSQGSRPTA